MIFNFDLDSALLLIAGRRQRRILLGLDTERNYRAEKQIHCRSLLLASDRQSLLQGTVFYDSSLRQECKFGQKGEFYCSSDRVGRRWPWDMYRWLFHERRFHTQKRE